jgi:hypothetical protein
MIDRYIVKSIGRDCSCGRPAYWSETPIPAPVCLGCDRQLPACVCERPVEALARIAEALEKIAQRV